MISFGILSVCLKIKNFPNNNFGLFFFFSFFFFSWLRFILYSTKNRSSRDFFHLQELFLASSRDVRQFSSATLILKKIWKFVPFLIYNMSLSKKMILIPNYRSRSGQTHSYIFAAFYVPSLFYYYRLFTSMSKLMSNFQ